MIKWKKEYKHGIYSMLKKKILETYQILIILFLFFIKNKICLKVLAN